MADVNGNDKPDVLGANCSVTGHKGCGGMSNGTVGVLINTSSPTALSREP